MTPSERNKTDVIPSSERHNAPRAGTSPPAGDAPPLDVVQRWFSAVISHPDGVEAGVEAGEAQAFIPLSRHELERVLTRSEKVSARERLSIYANAYYARLIECLSDSFPVLKRTVGEAVFNGFAFGYLQRYPSRTYTLCRLGDNFARYLDETRPDRAPGLAADSKPPLGWPDFLIDLATLEWTIEQVFDGPGVEGKRTLQAEDVLELAPDRWAKARLRTSPALRLLEFRFPVNAFYTLARKADKTAEIPPPGPAESLVAVSRRDYVVRRQELSRPQFALLKAVRQETPLAEAIACAAETCHWSDATLAAHLRGWFRLWAEGQLFIGLDI